MRQGAFQRVRPARGGNRRRARTTVGVVLAATLTACSAGPGDVPEPVGSEAPPTPSPTATAAPESEEPPEPVTAPERPPEMDQADEAGAIAAAKYVLRVAHYTVATGDLGEWDRLATSDCGFCANIRQSVLDVYGAGGHLEGGEFTLEQGSVVASDKSMSIFAVEVPFESAAVVEYDRAGALVTTEAAGSGIFTLEVMPAAGGWRLLEAGVLEGASG